MTSTAPRSLPALGICLEEYDYPYPVRFLSLSNDLQSVAMAYMDIQPTAAPNGKQSCWFMARHSAATTSATSLRHWHGRVTG